MDAKNILFKLKPIIIVILIFSLAFSLRAEASGIPGVPDQVKAYFQEDNGLPYFSEMDSYYNYRLTENFVEHGYLGDTIKNGTDWDLHSYFPPGRSAEYPPLIAWITAFFYYLANIFGDYSLLQVSFWTSAIVASLCIIPAFFFVRDITNDYGGIAAAIMVGLSTFYFSHTFAGFFDTDMFNMILPILVVWFFSVSITATERRKKILYAVYASISMLVFSLAWSGWWYILYLLVGVTIVYMLISKYILEKEESVRSWKNYDTKKEWFLDQPIILPLVLFLVISLLTIFLVWGTEMFTFLTQPFSSINLLSTTQHASSYPNVFVSVGELQAPTISAVVTDVGGIVPFLLGISGILALYWGLKPKTTTGKKPKAAKTRKTRKQKNRKKSRKQVEEPEIVKEQKDFKGLLKPALRDNLVYYVVLFTVWLGGTAYLLTNGIRFVESFSLPLLLCAGIFVGIIGEYLKTQIKTPSYHVIAMALVLILASYGPVGLAYSTANSVVPGTDDSMVDSLTWVNNNTNNNSVMTSWWDFGHLFAVKADRGVTFDGGSQNNARAYWVGKALYTSDETLSASILKMLSSSGDNGYNTLETYTNDTGKTVEIMDKILVVDKTAAENIMTSQYGLTAEQAKNVSQYTNPTNVTPDLFVTSYDMVGKAGWWSYFGSWNFTAGNSTNYIYSLAQANATSGTNSLKIMGENNVTIQINGSSVTGGISMGNKVVPPHRLMVVVNGTTAVDTIVNNDSAFSVMAIYQDNNMITVAMNRQLENSMFTRLYFLQGQGLSHFKLATKKPSTGISEVMVWNVT
ncbi:STT3 domain-containing protein [Methanobacterium sp. BAmetb5]|uniref:STT3 domain-containing protein n=1 Tax=Methanobacterium sp. BAmetb5 TaxID=2025351 RepID=UPI000E80EB4F|nr:STT3 domain-containing protein [Methanobacterium sp. BAmetb5]AXV40722.1 MAG: peptide transporter [Methanobacterium sp. BAmetb5]